MAKPRNPVETLRKICLALPAAPGVQELMIEEAPERFYRPPYVGVRGWLGVRLDVDVDWDEVAAIVEDSYRLIAPKKLVALLDA